MGIPSVATVPWTVNRLLRELLSVKVSELWREPTGKVSLMRLTRHRGLGRPQARRRWRRPPAPAPRGWSASARPSCPPPPRCCRTATSCIVAVTDDITARVHEVVERGAEGRGH